jgi:hypothetical protein
VLGSDAELFVDSLILIIHAKDSTSVSLVKSLLTQYDKESVNATYTNGQYIELYVDLIRQVISSNLDGTNKGQMESFLLKFKSNPLVLKDPELYSTLRRIFLESDLTQEMIEYYRTELSAALDIDRSDKQVRKLFAKLNSSHKDNESKLKLIQDINDICTDIVSRNKNSMLLRTNDGDTTIHDVDFSDTAAISKGFSVYSITNVKNVFTLGLQGLNRALGGRGLRLGESMVVNTLPFNGKSLMLLKMARWIVTLNSVSNEFKNPTCLFYSLENETPQNLRQLFREMWMSDKRAEPPRDMSLEEMVLYIHDQFHKNGWKLVIKRKLGSEFGPAELEADFNAYAQAGYTPMVVIIDYVNLMKKGETDSRDLAVRTLYNRICNFLKYNNCCFITAHQLNRKAAEVVRANPMGAVKKFTLDMLSDSTDPQREVDIVLYQNKEIDMHGRAWMTWKLDKHRYDDTTPEKDKYFAYMFDGPLGILDDIGGKDMSTDNIYAAEYDEDEEAETMTSASPASFG